MPIYVLVFVDSEDYGPTFNNLRLVFYNGIYRMDKIWVNSFRINALLKEILDHSLYQTEEQLATVVSTAVNLAKRIGDLVGLNFKYFFYTLDLDDLETELYVYPDDLITLDEVEFDKLDYPMTDEDVWVKYRYY